MLYAQTDLKESGCKDLPGHMSVNKSNKVHITQSLFSIQDQRLPPHMHPHAESCGSANIIPHWSPQQLGVCLFVSFWNYNCLFILDIALCFHASNKSSSCWTITACLAKQSQLRKKISPHSAVVGSLFIFFPEQGRCVRCRKVQHTARTLQAEAKFTSLCCHWYRSASSVVMETLALREGLRPRPGTVHVSWC